MSDSTKQPTAFETNVRNLENRINTLKSSIYLAPISDQLKERDAMVSRLIQRVKDIRTRGYVFDKNLEDQAQSYTQTWSTLTPAVQQEITSNVPRFEHALQMIEMQRIMLITQISNPTVGEPLYQSVLASVEALERQVEFLTRNLRTKIEPLGTQISTLDTQLQRLESVLTQIEQASFRLQPGENVISAVEAWLDRSDGDDPQGLLYLTDQRLVFEQKQDVATKKLLFITLESQHVHKVVFEVPLSQVSQANASKQGLLGHEDHLDLIFSGEASMQPTHFHLNGQDSTLWQTMIMRARAREYDADRVVAPKTT